MVLTVAFNFAFFVALAGSRRNDKQLLELIEKKQHMIDSIVHISFLKKRCSK